MEIGGLTLAEGASQEALELIQASTDLIANVGGLCEAIGTVVKSIHLLVAEREHDISYSSPAIPFSIFVSVPRADERNAVVRLAEAIIHEAMHLQLTLIEAVFPLISGRATTTFSPWKLEDRPIRGVLHGLYVFGVIFQALGSLGQSVPTVESYGAARQRQISTEIDSVEDIRQGLTSHGAELWKLLKSIVSAGDTSSVNRTGPVDPGRELSRLARSSSASAAGDRLRDDPGVTLADYPHRVKVTPAADDSAVAVQESSRHEHLEHFDRDRRCAR